MLSIKVYDAVSLEKIGAVTSTLLELHCQDSFLN